MSKVSWSSSDSQCLFNCAQPCSPPFQMLPNLHLHRLLHQQQPRNGKILDSFGTGASVEKTRELANGVA